MKRKVAITIMGILALIFAIFMVSSFNRTTQQIIQHQLDLDPTVTSSHLQEASSAAHTWQQFYDLRFTGSQLAPTDFAFDGKYQLALLDSPAQKLLVLDQSNKNFTTINLPPASVPATAITYGEQNLYLFADSLYLYHPTDHTWSKLTPDYQLPFPVTALEKFGDNFYLFGPNMIHKIILDKHRQYLGLEAWLDSSQNLTFTPQDVYLDGHIYLADVSGRVTRFLRGQATSWQPQATLFGPQYLSGHDDELFYLSPAQQKLSIFAANGQLQAEYSNPLLEDARFLWYDPASRTFYTLSGSLIYAFSLPPDSLSSADAAFDP